MTAKPRRRFRFTLRTLFVLVTVLCVWLGYELNAIRERRTLLAWIEEQGGKIDFDLDRVSWVRKENKRRVPRYRKLLGDKDACQIALPLTVTRSDWYRVNEVFPEAVIWILPEGDQIFVTPEPARHRSSDETADRPAAH